ncbi:MAG TPA: IS701 family transposase [Actinomycetota bacterium]
MGRVAGRFGRVEPRRRARALVLGLLADLPRKNCWTIAEHAGDATPDGMQHLLAGAVWDEHAVRDDVRDYLVEHLGDPEAVLVVDETGDLKKGASTVGVQRQYTGTAGKVDNAQVAVYLAYATGAGHGVIDRELYLPQGWLADAERCHAAGVPDQVGFATKSELARVMLERALDAGVPAGWVTADEVYGASPALRGWLETRRLPYVLTVKCTEPLPMPSGPPTPAARLAGRVPPAGWLRISAGLGAKGRRWYGWSRLPLSTAGAPQGWERWLLLRRSLTTGELAYYVCAGPAGRPLVALVRVAGCRWRVEEAFQAGKGLCGLDQHQVRRWRSWYRWVTLAMLAYAFLVVAAVTEHARHPPPLGLIPLTCNEVQHLFAALVAAPVADTGHWLRWSWWRRRRQARARACHYRRQAAQQP